MGGTNGADDGGIETGIRETVEETVGSDVDMAIFSQGDALEIHVAVPDLEERLSERIDGGSVETYSELKLTVSRR